MTVCCSTLHFPSTHRHGWWHYLEVEYTVKNIPQSNNKYKKTECLNRYMFQYVNQQQQHLNFPTLYSHKAFHYVYFLYSSYIFNIPTKCIHTVEYILLFIKSLLHVSAHTAPSSGRTLVTCSQLSAYCVAVTLVTKSQTLF